MPASTSNPARNHPTYAIGTGLFLQLLGVVHLFSFLSAWVQIDGLIGPNGIQPAGNFLHAVQAQLGSAAFWKLPTLCWWFETANFLHVLCGAGVLFSLLLIAGVTPGVSLAALWIGYLSLVNVGQLFYGFQWDSLLIEATFMALFVVPWKRLPLWRAHEPPAAARWLIIWVGFRLMFMSGVVKFASGDPTWANFTALDYHFETQPLPNSLSPFVHHLAPWVRHFACIAMLAIELFVVWLVFIPWRQARRAAALGVIGLMVAIQLTGNYTFFNLLVAILFLPALDDDFWRKIFRKKSLPPPIEAFPKGRPRAAFGLWGLFTAVVLLTSLQALPAITRRPVAPGWIESFLNKADPFRSLNHYGVFAVMTTSRPELIIEGSNDGITWTEYIFRHKPSTLTKNPGWVAPHQPRLDWQLWFAALGNPAQNRWLEGLCFQLLKGSKPVTELFASTPFGDVPPRQIRVLRYRYSYTTPGVQARTGERWQRTLIDTYQPAVSLR